MQKFQLIFHANFRFLSRKIRKVADCKSSHPNLLNEEIIQINNHAVSKKLEKKGLSPP